MDKHFCPYCMTPVAEGETCPSCGLTAGNYVPSPHHLQPGTVLLDRYLVGRVLGEGGFGITYIGCDLRLELKVAIKEYYPVDRATRNAAVSTNVTSFIGPSSKSFERGKQKFLSEARTMARMDKQQVIVSVRDFFEANNTVYIVMEYIEGTTFAELTEQRGGRIPPDELFRVIEPLFGALSALHETGLIHRDISPDNLMLENGEVRLLDFGCAREPADGNKTLTISLKHGYAPLEQYQESGQGPWTDIYALCATIYHCLTGQTPPRALDRIGEDNLILPSKLGVAITPPQEQALLKGLRIQPNRRFQTMKELWAALYAPAPETVAVTDSSVDKAAEEQMPKTEIPTTAAKPTPEEDRRIAPQEKKAEGKPLWKKVLPYGLGAAALLLLVLILALPKKNAGGEPGKDVVIPAIADSTPAPVNADAERDALFAEATVLSGEFSREDFDALMADDSVKAIVLDYDMDMSIFSYDPIQLGGSVITKPLRIEENTMVQLAHSTITETGYLDIRGAVFWNYRGEFRGSGEKVYAAPAHENGRPTFWAGDAFFLMDPGAFLTVNDIPEGDLPQVISRPDFSNAVTVTTPEELSAAEKAGTPVILGADFEGLNGLRVSALIPEGITVSSLSGSLSGESVTVVNRGTLCGEIHLSENAILINEGSFGGPTATLHADRNTVFLNLGVFAPVGNEASVVFDNTRLLNCGTMELRGRDGMEASVYLMDSSRLTNYGELRISEGGYLSPRNASSLINGEYLIVEQGGDLSNAGYIQNLSVIEVYGNFTNTVLENYGSLHVYQAANFAPAIQFGEGDFDMNEAAGGADRTLYYEHKYLLASEQGTLEISGGDPAENGEALLAALNDPEVGGVILSGDAIVDSDLSVTKPLRINSGLTMAEGTALTADHADLMVVGWLQARDITLKNDAVLYLESGSQFVFDGSMELDHALFCAKNPFSLQLDHTRIRLQNQAAVAVIGATSPMDSVDWTLEPGSYLVFCESTETLSYSNCSFSLENSDIRFGDLDLRLNNCRVQAENASTVFLFSGLVTLDNTQLVIGENNWLWAWDAGIDLENGSLLESSGEMGFWCGFGCPFELQDSRFVNHGKLTFHVWASPLTPEQIENDGQIVSFISANTTSEDP